MTYPYESYLGSIIHCGMLFRTFPRTLTNSKRTANLLMLNVGDELIATATRAISSQSAFETRSHAPKTGKERAPNEPNTSKISDKKNAAARPYRPARTIKGQNTYSRSKTCIS